MSALISASRTGHRLLSEANTASGLDALTPDPTTAELQAWPSPSLVQASRSHSTMDSSTVCRSNPAMPPLPVTTLALRSASSVRVYRPVSPSEV